MNSLELTFRKLGVAKNQSTPVLTTPATSRQRAITRWAACRGQICLRVKTNYAPYSMRTMTEVCSECFGVTAIFARTGFRST